MSTYRERREAKADRLRGWADKRVERAEADRAAEPSYVHDWAWITQPGLDRSKENRRTDRRFESVAKAESMQSRARGIDRQLRESIYSDDENAIEALEARIARRTAARDAMKATNAAFRKEHRAELKGLSAWDRDNALPHRSYEITNLTADIGRQRKRLEHLRREAAAREAVTESEWTSGNVTVRLTEARCEVDFPAKPDYEVRQGLKDHGFRWDRIDLVWYVPVGYSRGVDYAREAFPVEVAA